MIQRRASDATLETAISCHTFRATGITDYFTNGGKIEVAQRMARHSNAKTTGLYDRRNDDISVSKSGARGDLRGNLASQLIPAMPHVNWTAASVLPETVPFETDEFAAC